MDAVYSPATWIRSVGSGVRLSSIGTLSLMGIHCALCIGHFYKDVAD